MRKKYLVVCFVLLFVALAACYRPTPSPSSPVSASPTPTPSPTLPPATNEALASPTPEVGPSPILTSTSPCTPTQQLIGILRTEEQLAGPQITQTQSTLFPLHEVEFYPDSLEALAFESSLAGGFDGVARLALARPVPDPSAPISLSEALTTPWVLLVPEGDDRTARAWLDIRIEQPCCSEPEMAILERPIHQVITFTHENKPLESLDAVETARGKWQSDDITGQLWVDSLLIEESDELGAKKWTLYVFASVPGAPAGEDGRFIFCCRWLRCGQASRRWSKVCRTWGCTWVCK